MRQAVQQGRRHPLALEDLPPVSERQIAGDQQAGPLVAVGEDLEEQFCAGAAEGQVAQFVDDQQVGLTRRSSPRGGPVLLADYQPRVVVVPAVAALKAGHVRCDRGGIAWDDQAIHRAQRHVVMQQ